MHDAATPAPLAIAASFAIDPALEALAFWAQTLRLPLRAELAPYAQVIPQLLDQASPLRRASARVVAIRWSDLAGSRGPAAAARELAQALAAADDGAACCVVLCPDRNGDAALAMNGALREDVKGRSGIAVIDAAEAFATYDVAEPFDLRSEKTAHIPYTAEAMAVLGTMIARWRAAALRPPVKFIAVDGDQTLWTGVLGEDGVKGVGCGGGRRSLQEALVRSSRDGRIIGLFSKNDEADVASLFQQRGDFALRREHLLALQANWRPKPANLKIVADEFGVAEASIVFLDDNPVECAEMRAAAPGALTVMTPGEAALARFVDHLWLLDQTALTDADRKRTAAYREEAARKSAREVAPSLKEFFAGLDLEIDIAEAREGDFKRLAQMAERTSQFNASLQRLDERALRTDAAGSRLYAVSVKDRFGDYGIVGCMRAAVSGDRLATDLFMLSCRALGRGVEHRMVAHLGDLALTRGLKSVSFDCINGPRNAPALKFFALLAGRGIEEGTLTIPALEAATVAFDPENAAHVHADIDLPSRARAALAIGGSPSPARGRGDRGEGLSASTLPVETPSPPTPLPQAGEGSLGAIYERIANELTTGRDVLAAMAANVRARPELAQEFVAPAPGREADIAAIWEEILCVRPIGAHDLFRDLGGKSLHLVRIHGLIADRLGAEIDLASLFRFGTVALLARHLGDAAHDRVTIAEDRAALMRAARTARASRARQVGAAS